MRLTKNTVLTAGALVAALGAAAIAFDASARAASADARYKRLGAALDMLGDDLTEERAARRQHERSLTRLTRSLADLATRKAIPAPNVPAAPSIATVAEQPEETELVEFDELRRRVMEGKATPDEATRFWELAKTSDTLPAIIGRLEAAVAASPDDTVARLRLGRAFVAKLYTVPNGPARGAWAAKAETQWDEVLKRDAGNWEARFSTAFSYSQWPAMFGKGPAAVEHLETLVLQQESRAPLDRDTAVYHLLADLHQKAGRPESALQALKVGAARHPTDERLQAAVEGLRR